MAGADGLVAVEASGFASAEADGAGAGVIFNYFAARSQRNIAARALPSN